MKIFITTGTYNYLIKIKEMYPREDLTIMVNENGAILLHETIGETVFKEPRNYEVITSTGKIPKQGLVVIHYVSVTEEGRPLIEYHFKQVPKSLEKQEGLNAFRFLRPLSSDTFIILTAWESDTAFKVWKKLNSFDELYGKNTIPQKVFAGISYMKEYHLSE